MSEENLLTISNILNNTKVWDKISDATELRLDTNDDFFHEVEEFILENFERMNDERREN